MYVMMNWKEVACTYVDLDVSHISDAMTPQVRGSVKHKPSYHEYAIYHT